MSFFEVSMVAAALGVAVLWLRLRAADVVPPLTMLFGRLVDLQSGGAPGELGPLIAALYRSLIDRRRRTWWTRRHHVDGDAYHVLAEPRDALVLDEELA